MTKGKVQEGTNVRGTVKIITRTKGKIQQK